jgi:hypothetical protein
LSKRDTPKKGLSPRSGQSGVRQIIIPVPGLGNYDADANGKGSSSGFDTKKVRSLVLEEDGPNGKESKKTLIMMEPRPDRDSPRTKEKIEPQNLTTPQSIMPKISAEHNFAQQPEPEANNSPPFQENLFNSKAKDPTMQTHPVFQNTGIPIAPIQIDKNPDNPFLNFESNKTSGIGSEQNTIGFHNIPSENQTAFNGTNGSSLTFNNHAKNHTTQSGQTPQNFPISNTSNGPFTNTGGDFAKALQEANQHQPSGPLSS